MNHNSYYYPLKFFLFFYSIVILFCLQKSAFCRETDQIFPKASIGIGGLFGFDNVNHIEGEKTEWKPGNGIGGGFVFESMFSDTFGLHSGLWYSHFNLNAEFPDENSGIMTKYKIKSDYISMPLYLITSLSSKTVGFNILTGLNLIYITRSRMEPGMNGQSSENILEVLNTGQIGAGAGFEVLLKITKFTRIFISFTGEYYFENLVKDNDGSIDHLYIATVRSGIMLCTF